MTPRFTVPVPRTEVARPLLRSTLTFNPDTALGGPATVEIVVIDDQSPEEFPELQEAGWGCHVLSNYAVYFRIVY